MIKTNKSIFFIMALFLFGCAFYGHSQRSKSALSLSGGYVPDGYAVKLGYNHYHNRTDFVKIALIGAIGNQSLSTGLEIPFNDFIVDGGYFASLVKSPTSGISLAVGGGLSLGYENVNNGESVLDDGSILLSESGFIYGLFVGSDFDFFISEKISLIIPVDFHYHFNSDLGNSLFVAGLGVRYYFN